MLSMYSEAEQKLIGAISKHWLDVITKTEINPPTLYRCLAEEVFVEDRKGPEVEALRRCCKAIITCNPYRMTKEFDSLCEF